MQDRNLHEVDVQSVMIRRDAMERFHEKRIQAVPVDSGNDSWEVTGSMTMFVDNQGYLYMRLLLENDNEIFFPVSPDEWLPRHAA